MSLKFARGNGDKRSAIRVQKFHRFKLLSQLMCPTFQITIYKALNPENKPIHRENGDKIETLEMCLRKTLGLQSIMKIFRAFFFKFKTWHDSHHGRTVMLSFIFRFIFTLVHISCFCCSCSISFNCCPYGFPKWSIWDSERWHLNQRKSVFVPPGLFLLLLSYLPWIHMAARK